MLNNNFVLIQIHVNNRNHRSQSLLRKYNVIRHHVDNNCSCRMSILPAFPTFPNNFARKRNLMRM